MDWSAIFAGTAALTSIAGLVYSVRQHRDNIRKEFLLWVIGQLQSPEQREARALVFWLNGQDNESTIRKQALLDGIASNSIDTLYGDDYKKIRLVFALFNNIGYFWSRLGYGEIKDARALFPQVLEIWELGRPFIMAIRNRPNQGDSFYYFEKLVEKLKPPKS
jgi:hypothetical protein